MPATVKCSSCGYVYLQTPIIPGVPTGRQNVGNGHRAADWYYDLYREFKGHCPKCQKKMPSPLAYANAMTVEVKPA